MGAVFPSFCFSPLPLRGGEGRVTPTLSPTLTRGGEGNTEN
jgi:hypothetical protein